MLLWLLLSCSGAVLGAIPHQIKLVQDLLDKYDKKAKPIWDNSKPINVSFSMDLYQILELNEPQQYILLNAWIIERWYDEFLYWDPKDYDNITELRLPHDTVWLPDTTLYNSLVMKDDDTRRLLNAKVTTNTTRKASLIELLYPTIYKFSCLLNLRFFPFDVQVCTMTFSSWTYDQKGIDYFPYSNKIGTTNYLENEGWYMMDTQVVRSEVKYKCCPAKYTLLQLTLHLRRKPLFYLVNLIIPTSIITLIAIVGFFSTSSASGMREEKVSLGITTLLSMSILMLMVSDQMPTTSTFIPLIGWFILAMIIVISLGTIVSSVIIAVQKRGRLGERLSRKTVKVARVIAYFTCTAIPPHLEKELMAEQADKADEISKIPMPSLPAHPETKPLSQASKMWLGLRHRPGNGVSMVSEKSTDPLIHLSPSETGVSATAEITSPTSPIGLASLDDELSIGGESVSSTRPPTSRMAGLLGRSGDGKGTPAPTATMNLAGEDHSCRKDAISPSVYTVVKSAMRQNRQWAQMEFEWLATVMERMCFVLFVIAFLIITVGINFVGFVHWAAAGHETEQLKQQEIVAEPPTL
ncbi:hypothetical protein PMAYCL1PPCAC_07659 [Pristionchus mayeri]|uniref:Uncharacterized protein n=1 Tax=Pristionchus mayeri TaxID=1317129 RepID=A0AAN4ZCJ6_9BILA|nr:hypothetical protein PMAYCL1PPCAC_07659 [Pristionchus mayeri]